MDIGHGTVISFANGFCREVIDITPPSPTRESIPTSHMETPGHKTFMPSRLVDWGDCKLTMAFDEDADIPIDQPPETITITFPQGKQWTFTGFLTNLEPKVPLEDRMTVDVTLKVTGLVAGSGASSQSV